MATIHLTSDEAVDHYSLVGICRIGDRYVLSGPVVKPWNVHHFLNAFLAPVVVKFQEVSTVFVFFETFVVCGSILLKFLLNCFSLEFSVFYCHRRWILFSI
jgi:hypothetical protein